MKNIWPNCVRRGCAHCDRLLLSFADVIYLPCLHVLCSDTCLEMNVVDNDNDQSREAPMTSTPNSSYTCPKCLLAVDQETVAKWRDLGAAIFYKESLLTCTECTRLSDALYWCAECGDSLCPTCKETHEIRRRTANHVVTFLDPASAASSGARKEAKDVLLCSQHGVESGDYCLACRVPLCKEPDCQQPHSGHELKNTKQAIDAFRLRAATMNEKMIGFLEQANPLVESLESEITRELDPEANSEVLAAFQAEFKRIIEFVAKCKTQVRERLKASALTKVSELKNRSLKVSSLKGQITNYLNKFEDTLGLSSQQIARNLGLLELRLDIMHDALETVIVTVTRGEDPTATAHPFNQIQTVDNLDSSAADSGANSSSSTAAQIGSPPKPLLESASVAGPLQIGDYLKPLQKITRGLQELVIAVTTSRDPQLVLSQRHRKIIEPASDMRLEVELNEVNPEIEQECFTQPKPTLNTCRCGLRRSETAAAAQCQSTTDKLKNSACDDEEDEDAGAAMLVKEPVSRKRKADFTTSSNSSGQNGRPGGLLTDKTSAQPMSAGGSEGLAHHALGTLSKSSGRSPSREKNGTGSPPSPNTGSGNNSDSEQDEEPIIPTGITRSRSSATAAAAGVSTPTPSPTRRRASSDEPSSALPADSPDSSPPPHPRPSTSGSSVYARSRAKESRILGESLDRKTWVKQPVSNELTEPIFALLPPQDQQALREINVGRFYDTWELYQSFNATLLELYGLGNKRWCCAVCPHFKRKIEKARDTFHSFASKDAFHKHYDRQHYDPKMCEICKQEFLNLKHLKGHLHSMLTLPNKEHMEHQARMAALRRSQQSANGEDEAEEEAEEEEEDEEEHDKTPAPKASPKKGHQKPKPPPKPPSKRGRQ